MDPGSGIAAMSINKNGTELIIAYTKSIKGVAAVKRSISATGLGTPLVLIKAPAKDVLNGFTQIKKFNGKLYFLSANKLMKISPGGIKPVLAHDFKISRARIESFAFTSAGDLYLASNNLIPAL